MIHTTLDNFFLDDEALENSPSRRSGIDRDTESTLRNYGCELIQEAGILLGFQQVVMATGQVLFHRFYCKRSMKEYNVKKVAATALWQGAKLEEAPEVSGHPRELLNKIMVAVDRCILRRETADGRKMPILDLHSKESEEFRRSLIRYEIEMLKAFGFITHVEHPHKLLLNYVQILGLDFGMEHDEAEFPGFVQEAWNLANDSLRTTLCVRYKSSVIAAGIIFYVSRKLKVPLPESPPWYDIFHVKLSEIYDICAALHQLYNAPKAQFIPVCHQILPNKPPTPATAGATAGVTVDGATPTPMLGRPGAKPLDPSVRIAVADGSVIAMRTPRQANGAVPIPVAGVVGSSTPAAAFTPPSGAPSPQLASPGSTHKRKDHSASRSPALNEARKRQRPDNGQHEPQRQPEAAQQGKEEAKRPLSRSSMRSRSRSRSASQSRDRDEARSVKHSSRSRSRDRSHHRDSSKGGGAGGRTDGRYDRERDRRDRDRDRSHHHSRGREQHGGPDRDRDRHNLHTSTHRDGRERRDGERRDMRRDGSDRDRDRRGGADMRPSSRGRESDRRERPDSSQVKQQQQQPSGSRFPPPPPVQGAGHNGVSSPRKGGAAGSSKQNQVAEPADSSRRDEQHSGGAASQPPRPSSAGGSKPTSPVAAVPPRPKPVAVRKRLQQQADGATDKTPATGAAESAGS